MESKQPGLGPTEEQGVASVDNGAHPEANQNAEAAAELAADATHSPDPVNDGEENTAPQPSAEAAQSAPQAEAETAQPQEAAPEAPSAESESGATPSETTTQEQPAAAEAAPSAEAAAQPAGPRLKRGSLVEGTIISTSPTQVIVDVGTPEQGIIPGHELERMSRNLLETLKEGAKVTVYVVNPRDHNGNVVLSINRALEELDWQRAEEHRQTQQVYETRVAGYNKGGLIVRFGRVRGFVPQSQMSIERRRMLSGETPEERWGKMVNEPISVKVMEVDRSRNRLILSERSASRETREKRKEALIGQLREGEVRIGHVVSLEDFGAFVDVGGAEGLVHLTELSWKHVNHPRDLLHVGQEVKVEVISVDREQKRIGLSMKRQEPDPWDMIAIHYNVGQLVQGVITKLTKFGAFARLVDVPEIEGLIHISELSDRRVNHPKEVVSEGERLTLRVVKVDIANRRLGLSLKRVNSAEYLDQDWSAAMDEAPGPLAEAPATSDEPAAEPVQAASEPSTQDVVESAQPAGDAPPASEETEDELRPVEEPDAATEARDGDGENQ